VLKTKEMKKETDFLVIGSGVAGLSFALKAAKYGTVSVLSKNDLEETNTKICTRGNCCCNVPADSFEKHIRDTIIVGDGLCDEEIVEIVVREAPERIKELIEWGVDFDHNKTFL